MRHTTEAELRAMAERGMTGAEIAESLGAALPTVRAACCLLGIHTQGKCGRKRTMFGSAFLPLVAQGKCLQEIAEQFNCSRTSVQRALKRDGLPGSARAFLQSQSREAA